LIVLITIYMENILNDIFLLYHLDPVANYQSYILFAITTMCIIMF